MREPTRTVRDLHDFTTKSLHPRADYSRTSARSRRWQWRPPVCRAGTPRRHHARRPEEDPARRRPADLAIRRVQAGRDPAPRPDLVVGGLHQGRGQAAPEAVRVGHGARDRGGEPGGVAARDPAAAQPDRARARGERGGRRARVSDRAARRRGRDRGGRARGGGCAFLCTLLCLDAGLRLGEATALDWEDVQWDRRSLHVRRSLSPGKHLGPTKSGRSRSVAMSRRLMAELLKAHMGAGRPASGAVALVEHANYRHRAFRRMLKAAGIMQHVTPHGLRDTYASHLLSAGVQLAYVSAQLGHSDVAITA
ncbi:MAG: site-specific integrase [Candidatus Eisenbacteria bacterium]|uniref:Site-specific integrase n=1 Tax=Eiseniibacteriota bacterium TaxID=2212470 RepID=A0A538TYF3_UNCEI|nr:MAG: site-specific integrase [Candidatus Eisenbacteria bacterium]